MQVGASTAGHSREVPQKTKNRTALSPSGSTSGCIFKETQNTTSKEYVHPYVHCSVIYNNQGMEAAQVPVNRQVNKEVVMHIDNGISLSHGKE